MGSICHKYLSILVHSTLYETYLLQWFSRNLCSIGEGGGVNLPWVYVHSALCETTLV